LARGEYVARQDADDISAPTRLEKQVTFLQENPQISVVGVAFSNIDADGNAINLKRLPQDPLYVREHLLVNLVIAHAAVLFRRVVLDNVGRYDEQVGSAEDLDLWLRIAENFQLSNLLEVLYSVRVHSASVVGAGLRRHLESVYLVRHLTLERWQQTRRPLAPPEIIARARLLMACQDFIMGREGEGVANLQAAQLAFPQTIHTARQNAADIANMALNACRLVTVPSALIQWETVGTHYIEQVVTRLPAPWTLSARQVRAQFFVSLSFQAYVNQQYPAVLRYAIKGCLADPLWLKNRGLWIMVGYALLKRRGALLRSMR